MTTRKGARLGGVTPIPPELLTLVPDNVREASDNFAAALDRHRAASSELSAAHKDVESARKTDRHAATEAELAGEPLPKAKTPTAEEKVRDGERAAEGARNAAEQMQQVFLSVLHAQLGPIVERAKGELERIGDDAVGHVDAIAMLLTERSQVQRLLAELGDGSYLLGRNTIFNVAPPRAGRDLPSGPLGESIDQLRANLGVGETEAA